MFAGIFTTKFLNENVAGTTITFDRNCTCLFFLLLEFVFSSSSKIECGERLTSPGEAAVEYEHWAWVINILLYGNDGVNLLGLQIVMCLSAELQNSTEKHPI